MSQSKSDLSYINGLLALPCKGCNEIMHSIFSYTAREKCTPCGGVALKDSAKDREEKRRERRAAG